MPHPMGKYKSCQSMVRPFRFWFVSNLSELKHSSEYLTKHSFATFVVNSNLLTCHRVHLDKLILALMLQLYDIPVNRPHNVLLLIVHFGLCNHNNRTLLHLVREFRDGIGRPVIHRSHSHKILRFNHLVNSNHSSISFTNGFLLHRWLYLLRSKSTVWYCWARVSGLSMFTKVCPSLFL